MNAKSRIVMVMVNVLMVHAIVYQDTKEKIVKMVISMMRKC